MSNSTTSDFYCHLLSAKGPGASCPGAKCMSTGNSSSNNNAESGTEEQLRHLLELLRIKASTHVLSWVLAPDDADAGGIQRLTSAYHYLMSAGEIVRRRSSETAVTFLYLPLPPTKESDHAKYLQCLATLTENWPPTLMVRGVSPVTSTTL